jgi:uncharacterized membrane protein YfcA
VLAAVPTRALLASPLGFFVGLSLGALGGGGSILAVPVLVYGAGQTPAQATAGSLLIVAIASLVGLVPHLRAGRVRVAQGLLFGFVGIGGAFAGTKLNAALNPDVLLLAFSGLILVAAWRMVTGCPTCTRVGEERVLAAEADTAMAGGAPGATATATATVTSGARPVVDVTTIVKIVVAGTAVGFLTGLFGVGGGFVIVPALTLLLRYPMTEAVGTSLLIIFVNTVVAFTLRLGGPVPVAWATTLPFVAAAVIGVLVGGSIAGRVPAETLLRWFAGLLVVLALAIGTGAVLALV